MILRLGLEASASWPKSSTGGRSTNTLHEGERRKRGTGNDQPSCRTQATADWLPPRSDCELATPQRHRAQRDGSVWDSAGQVSREVTVPHERSEARSAASSQESSPPASQRQERSILTRVGSSTLGRTRISSLQVRNLNPVRAPTAAHARPPRLMPAFPPRVPEALFSFPCLSIQFRQSAFRQPGGWQENTSLPLRQRPGPLKPMISARRTSRSIIAPATTASPPKISSQSSRARLELMMLLPVRIGRFGEFEDAVMVSSSNAPLFCILQKNANYINTCRCLKDFRQSAHVRSVVWTLVFSTVLLHTWKQLP